MIDKRSHSSQANLECEEPEDFGMIGWVLRAGRSLHNTIESSHLALLKSFYIKLISNGKHDFLISADLVFATLTTPELHHA